MLFNSYPFLFAFLPIALLGYEVAGRFHRKAVILWLGFSSLVFYAWWHPALLLLLVASVSINYGAAALISRRVPGPASPRVWLYLAIAINLLLLGYYKYFFPSLNALSAAFGVSSHWANVILPLGISFFTFTQIAFLVDLYSGRAAHQDFPSYLLFVTFFPHLIAGPILHHREMMPQFKRQRYRLHLQDLTVGGSWLVLGLAKKVLIADTLADIADPIFQVGASLSPSLAWVGVIAYALQLYFDFSGYSDMALGLARMFSIDFPLNFNSPFKSASSVEMWQRWHMTLGRYIFTYIYHPLQRRILARRLKRGRGISRQDRRRVGAFLRVVALPLLFTMLLAGIWHGAGLQFMVFGVLNGIYMSVNYAWRQFRPGRRSKAAPDASRGAIARWSRHSASVMFTFFWVMISAVFFRAASVGHASAILAAMFGTHYSVLGAPDLGAPDVRFARSVALVLVGLAIAWGLPNTQQILTRFRPSLQPDAWNQKDVPHALQWRPSAAWAVAIGVVFFVVLVELQQPSTFLYFQF